MDYECKSGGENYELANCVVSRISYIDNCIRIKVHPIDNCALKI